MAYKSQLSASHTPRSSGKKNAMNAQKNTVPFSGTFLYIKSFNLSKSGYHRTAREQTHAGATVASATTKPETACNPLHN